jgi:hypothetical protein
MSSKMKKTKYQKCGVRPAFNRVIEMSLLTGVEVSGPRVINIKQYLNRNSFSSNLHKPHNFIPQRYFINNSVVIITLKII